MAGKHGRILEPGPQVVQLPLLPSRNHPVPLCTGATLVKRLCGGRGPAGLDEQCPLSCPHVERHSCYLGTDRRQPEDRVSPAPFPFGPPCFRRIAISAFPSESPLPLGVASILSQLLQVGRNLEAAETLIMLHHQLQLTVLI